MRDGLHRLTVFDDGKGHQSVELDGRPFLCTDLRLTLSAGKLTTASVDLPVFLDAEVTAELAVNADALGSHQINITPSGPSGPDGEVA